MKKSLIFLISLIFSAAANAAPECASDIMNEGKRVNVLSLSKTQGMNKAQVKIWENHYRLRFSDDDLNEPGYCPSIMDVTTYQDANNNSYVEMTTNSDDCDGGNVFGIIYSTENMAVVGEINDSSYGCPRKH